MNERRILIYGVCGSGKTTFAERLSRATGIPWTSVDDLTWRPNWTPAPDEEQMRTFQRICEADEWILDTAYSKWRHVVLARAQLVIALDYPRWISYSRLLRRTLGRVIDGRPVCNGNRESWRLALSRDSILVWHFRSFSSKRRRIREWSASSDGPRVIVFRHPKEADAFLREVSRAGCLPSG